MLKECPSLFCRTVFGKSVSTIRLILWSSTFHAPFFIFQLPTNFTIKSGLARRFEVPSLQFKIPLLISYTNLNVRVLILQANSVYCIETKAPS